MLQKSSFSTQVKRCDRNTRMALERLEKRESLDLVAHRAKLGCFSQRIPHISLRLFYKQMLIHIRYYLRLKRSHFAHNSTKWKRNIQIQAKHLKNGNHLICLQGTISRVTLLLTFPILFLGGYHTPMWLQNWYHLCLKRRLSTQFKRDTCNTPFELQCLEKRESPERLAHTA